MSNLKISIITAVYNNCNTICDTLDSVFSQTYTNVEVVVIDGGSSDGTLKLLESYLDRLDVLVSEPDEGIYDALNKGIKNSSGDVVGFLHADDIFENSDVLAKVADTLKDPEIEAVYGDLVYVRRNDVNQVIRSWKSDCYDATALSRGWMPPHPTFYVKSSVYKRLGGFDTHYRIAADYDLVLRFLNIGKVRAVYIPNILVRMRVGGISNRSLITIIRKSCEDYSVLQRNKVGGIATLICKNFRKLSQFWRR